jgi:hypothetical protein
MAFVRKKGKSFYLVHNVREDGRVRQVHLACLGNRPRVSEEVVREVQKSHPDLQIDWNAVRGRAATSFASPFADREGAEQLIRNVRNLTLDVKELNLSLLSSNADDKVGELLQELRGLRSAVEDKLAGWTAKPPESAPAPAAVHEQTGD